MNSDYRFFWESVGGRCPRNWDFVSILDLLEDNKSISVGVMYPGQHTENGIPLVKVSNVKNGIIEEEPNFYISNEVDEEYKRTRLNGSELLITLVGNPGDCVVVKPNMIGWNVARALAVVRLKDPKLREWLRYVLLSKPAKHLIEARLNTTVQKTLNLKDIKELAIPLPKESVRNRITKIVSSLDQKIELNNQINQTLEAMAQALFKSWFVDFEPVKAKIEAKATGADAEGVTLAAMEAISGQNAEALAKLAQTDPERYAELKATAELFPDALVESELGEIPEKWIVYEINDIADVTKLAGFEFSKYFDYSDEGEIIALRALNVVNGLLDLTKVKRISREVSNNLERSKLFKNDMLLTYTGKIGDVALINENNKYHLAPNVCRLRCFNPDTLPIFYWFSRSPVFSQRITDFTVGSTQKTIPMKSIRKIKVILPPNNTHAHLGKNFSILIESIHRSINEIKYLSSLRDTLLPKLLSGELSVKDIELAESTQENHS